MRVSDLRILTRQISGWKNIHWARVGEDDRRESIVRANAMRSFLSEIGSKSQSAPESKPLADIVINREGDQFTFDLAP